MNATRRSLFTALMALALAAAGCDPSTALAVVEITLDPHERRRGDDPPLSAKGPARGKMLEPVAVTCLNCGPCTAPTTRDLRIDLRNRSSQDLYAIRPEEIRAVEPPLPPDLISLESSCPAGAHPAVACRGATT